ncbi:acyl carrier protein [Streptomyces antimicrobicus]|uniref:Acyl carrier protein n=1 Tax=Streptomyces antimicrobicus TaxID=2883108 RepID=A0ABS8BFS0_9ACTN|nr:acyl carrier protein [Streptomyces antimicrobicus]MCB5183460.1 acyl carrier protein [Streptomyces antimicrobicus]
MDQAVLDWLNTDPDWDLPETVTDGPLAADVTAPSAAALASASQAEREEIMFEYARAEVARSVGLTPAALDTERTLVSVGVGSMLGCELQYRLRDALGVAPELKEILMAKDTHALAGMLLALLGYGG